MVNSLVSLDGEPGDCVSLQDPTQSTSDGGHETAQSSPVWSKEGLANTAHTVVVSSCGPFIVVDAFTYVAVWFFLPLAFIVDFLFLASYTVSSGTTVPPTSSSSSTGGGVSSTSSSSTSSSNTATASASSSPSSNRRTTAIVVGAAIGGVAVAAALILLFIFCLQRRSDKAFSDGSQTKGGSFIATSPSPLLSNNSLQPGNRNTATSSMMSYNYQHPAQQNGLLNPPPNGLVYNNMPPYDPNAPQQFSHWSTASPGSHYPNTLTTISEGGSPFSDISRRPNLPEL